MLPVGSDPAPNPTSSSVRSPAARICAFNLAQTCSMGCRSGRYGAGALPHAPQWRRALRDRMDGEVVPYNEVAGCQGGAAQFLHIGQEQRPIYGSGGHHRRDQPGLAHGSHQGRGLPMTLRHRAPHTLTAWPPAPLPNHRRVQPGFIHEHQVRGISARLQRLPVRAFQAHVRASLFGW